jgi:hypothetical protein
MILEPLIQDARSHWVPLRIGNRTVISDEIRDIHLMSLREGFDGSIFNQVVGHLFNALDEKSGERMVLIPFH